MNRKDIKNEGSNDLDELIFKCFKLRYLDKINIYCFSESTDKRGDDKTFYYKYIKDKFENYDIFFKSAGNKKAVYDTYTSLGYPRKVGRFVS